MKRISRLVILAALMSFTSAQTAGKISGTVSSNDGQTLAGANVIVDGTANGAATDADGQYNILNVSAGTYSVTVNYIGYKNTTVSNVQVKSGLTTPMDFALESSVIEGDAITIVGVKRLIEPSATNSVRTMGAEEIQNSASRSVTGMLEMQAGVTVTNGDLHIRGSREEEVAYTIDGADIKDVVYSGRMASAIPEALSEIAVEAGGYGAHIGGANSGVVRQTLRTGGSSFGGSARLESGDYGHTDVTGTVSGPAGPVKFFAAFRQTHTDDHSPAFYESFDINGGDPMASYLSGVTADGDSIAVVFDGDNIAHRAQDDLDINATASMDMGPLNIRYSFVNNNSNWQSNTLPIRNMFNTERQAAAERTFMSNGLRLNYFLNPNFLITGGFSQVSRDYESWDDLFGKPGNFTEAISWGDSASVADKYSNAAEIGADWKNKYTDPEPYYVGLFNFTRQGDVATGWSHNHRTTRAFDMGITVQRGDHEIRAGFERKDYTYSSYSLSTGAMKNINTAIDAGTFSRDNLNKTDADLVDKMSLWNRFGNIGYDDFGNEVTEGLDAPRHPFQQSFYVNDKYEAGDVVVSAGVRVDQFNNDDWKMTNPTNPPWDESNQGVYADSIDASDTKTSIQPRLGLAFPVSDKTVFHLQYGRYAQMPELRRPWAATRYMHLVWGGQNYTPDPMGFDLDPIETTQYEVGLSYQFIADAAIDMTAFAKNTTGQIVIAKRDEIDPTQPGYTGAEVEGPYYVNGDFTTVNGLEFTLRTRRISRLQTYASYTWTDARGINTDPNTSAGNLSQDKLAAPPKMIMPLYYENRHRLNIAADFRFGENDGFLNGLGMNLQYKLNSGHPYTLSDGGMGQRSADIGALLSDARAREPQEPIGQSTTPWQSNVDLKVDYRLKVGPSEVTLFAYVENLFGTQNVINVYSRSGNAYDDGFLTDPALSSQLVAANGATYVELYEQVNLANRQHYTESFGQDLFGTPKSVKMGISVGF
jgi:hypothetical protein